MAYAAVLAKSALRLQQRQVAVVLIADSGGTPTQVSRETAMYMTNNLDH
jgi:hypothetical protein